MKRFHWAGSLLLALFFFTSCADRKDSIQFLDVNSIHSGEANLFSSGKQLFLTWIEYENDSLVNLLFSELQNHKWSAPKTIASGDDWFVNWADFPSLVSYKNNPDHLAAHWLQKSDSGTYDYDVHIAQSTDAGQSWSESFIPHRDSIAAEHGFVSMLPLDDGHIFACWLDGRHTKADEEGNTESNGHSHGLGGAMSLRSAEFDMHGKLSQESELDNKVCDCCQTAAAMTDNGIIVAYRDRFDEEIRDISIVRQLDGHWTEPKTVYNDRWKIAGCPVNGPAIDAIENHVSIAWFTMSEEQAKVKFSYSSDSGANFFPPIKIDNGRPIGRIDVKMIDPETSLISWIEETDESAYIILAHINHSTGTIIKKSILETSAARSSGFPIMEVHQKELYLVWTQIEPTTQIKSARIDYKQLFNN